MWSNPPVAYRFQTASNPLQWSMFASPQMHLVLPVKVNETDVSAGLSGYTMVAAPALLDFDRDSAIAPLFKAASSSGQLDRAGVLSRLRADDAQGTAVPMPALAAAALGCKRDEASITAALEGLNAQSFIAFKLWLTRTALVQLSGKGDPTRLLMSAANLSWLCASPAQLTADTGTHGFVLGGVTWLHDRTLASAQKQKGGVESNACFEKLPVLSTSWRSVFQRIVPPASPWTKQAPTSVQPAPQPKPAPRRNGPSPWAAKP